MSTSPSVIASRFPVAPPGREIPVLLGLAVALVVLFVIGPPTLAGGTYGRSFVDNGALVDATRTSLVAFWGSGTGELPPALRSAADYWVRYHVVKAVIAALLAAVLLVLALRAWRTLAGPDDLGRGRTVALTVSAAGAAGLAAIVVVVVLVNVQGALAPLSSLLSLLGPGERSGDVAATIDQIRGALSSPAGAPAGPQAAALERIVDDFARYHAVFAALAAAAAAGLVVLARVAVRVRASSPGLPVRARRLLRALGVGSIALALLLAVVCLANVSNATDPEEGLRIFFAGA